MNIYFKWILLVGINLPFSLLFALDLMKTIETALGVILGVISFILLYVWQEKFLLRMKYEKWRNALLVGVGGCALLLLYPGFPMLSGALALELSGGILGLGGEYGSQHLSFFSIYLTTIIDGILLSSLVLVLSLFARVIFMIKTLLTKKIHDK